eukprot:jgi/Tetstr1/463161/TSEL_008095.t1
MQTCCLHPGRRIGPPPSGLHSPRIARPLPGACLVGTAAELRLRLRAARRRGALRPAAADTAAAGPGGGGGGRGTGGRGGRGSGGDGGDEPDAWPWRWRWRVAALLVVATGLQLSLGPARASGESTGGPSVSIIIPVLNESKHITQTLRFLKLLDPLPLEVIVVDGGSQDGTAKLAARQGAKVVGSVKGRGRQMNEGAALAKGDILCFLHADTLPPLNLVAQTRATLSKEEVVLGGFFPLIQEPDRVLWFPTLHNAAKTWYAPMLFRPVSFARGLRLLFGDQAQFCRASDFRRLGGFDPELIIMEDADLCIRMHMQARGGRRRGAVRMLPSAVQTSGRRIGSWGNLRATWIHFRIALQWYLGGTPGELRTTYNKIYTDNFR